jgi:hypothetical protein
MGHGGGFSLNAAVRIEATDRKGLERLLRYCARPLFAGDHGEGTGLARLLEEVTGELEHQVDDMRLYA